MFVLTSEISIGSVTFKSVHDVQIKRSIYSLAATAVVKVPVTAVLKHEGEPPAHIETANAIKAGDAVTIKLGYDGQLQTEFVGYVKRLNYKLPLEIECEDEYYKLRFVNCVFSKKETSLKACLNEVLSGVYDLNNCAIAVVPIGSGNDFIRSFGIEKEKYLDIDNLINGREVFVDLLKCGDRVSGNSITIGFDCAVAKNFVKFNKRKHISSELAYKLSIFYCILKERVHNFTVITDGEKLNIDGTYLLSICAKGKYYGGGIKCAPLADNSDGYVDFTAIKTVGVL